LLQSVRTISSKVYKVFFASAIVEKKRRLFSGIWICRIARIQVIRFLIRAIRKIRIQKAFSCLVPGWRCGSSYISGPFSVPGKLVPRIAIQTTMSLELFSQHRSAAMEPDFDGR
jgi:hypothetical protein